MGRRPDIAALLLNSGVLRPMTELSDIIQLPASDEEKELQVALLERGGFSEEELEIALIVVPDLFDPAPFFVGRQLPTDSLPRRLDLLGIDPEHGFLKVYELKKGPIQRIAIAQVLDYMLWVCETKTEDLAWQIITHGGEDNGIGRFWKPEKNQGVRGPCSAGRQCSVSGGYRNGLPPTSGTSCKAHRRTTFHRAAIMCVMAEPTRTPILRVGA